MIPTIGLIISAYVILRCLDIMGRNKSQFSSEGVRVFIVVIAVVVIVFVSALSFDLMTTSATVPGVPSLTR